METQVQHATAGNRGDSAVQLEWAGGAREGEGDAVGSGSSHVQVSTYNGNGRKSHTWSCTCLISC